MVEKGTEKSNTHSVGLFIILRPQGDILSYFQENILYPPFLHTGGAYTFCFSLIEDFASIPDHD